jgi:glycosyltransferase involved in cell wall biosynthesis
MALPKVSIVICAYNAASTLRECLMSLGELDYPDYEVILVDDGSTDATPQIATDFPQFHCIRQSNHGLSHARNVGWRESHGQIIAYTDADCVVDKDWIRCLIQAMLDQDVDAIGGPNITACHSIRSRGSAPDLLREQSEAMRRRHRQLRVSEKDVSSRRHLGSLGRRR